MMVWSGEGSTPDAHLTSDSAQNSTANSNTQAQASTAAPSAAAGGEKEMLEGLNFPNSPSKRAQEADNRTMGNGAASAENRSHNEQQGQPAGASRKGQAPSGPEGGKADGKAGAKSNGAACSKKPEAGSAKDKVPEQARSIINDQGLVMKKWQARRSSWSKSLTDLESEEHITDLSAEERESIRRSCVLLQDALEGRSSHGLYVLLDGPAWKRVLFKVQTADWWQNCVIVASLVHALLFFFEAPNYRSSWIDPTMNSWDTDLVEIACIICYASDVAMKMLYFGGWKDYVSKEWQRNYVIMIFAFIVDHALFYLRLCPLRFSRPVRLCIIAGRHRDVRRLASFLPLMAAKLVHNFALPMLGAILFFGAIFSRVYGTLPSEMKPDFGEDSFDGTWTTMRALFLLTTLDNYDIVNTAFMKHPSSFILFLLFIIVTTWFLMSVALGIIYDVYLEDHEKTVASEAAKEVKSMDKAFGKTDFRKRGYIDWIDFKEMMWNLRPHDDCKKHAYTIFKELATPQKAINNMLAIDKTKFRDIGRYLPVRFVKVHQAQPGQSLDSNKGTPADLARKKWVQWHGFNTTESRLTIADAMIVALGVDHLNVGSLYNDLHKTLVGFSGISTLEVDPELFQRCFQRDLAEPHLQLGFISLSLLVFSFAVEAILDSEFLVRCFQQRWRRVDFLVLILCACSHFAHEGCHHPGTLPSAFPGALCQAPWLQLVDALSALRLVRVALHNGFIRSYLLSVLQVVPVLLHLGGLVLCVVYASAVTTMELLAKPPSILLTEDGYRLNMVCMEAIPNFDCPSSSMMSIFQLFVNAGLGDVVLVEGPPESRPGTVRHALMSVYFMSVYAVLGICLVNLLTTLIVEFHKILLQEKERAKKERQQILGQGLRGVVGAVRLALKAKINLKENIAKTEEIMVGFNEGSWRRRFKI